MKTIMMTRISIIIFSLLLFPNFMTQAKDKLTLTECISHAQTNSPAAKIAKREFRISLARMYAYKASYMPQLNFNATLPSFNRSIGATETEGGVKFVSFNSINNSARLSINQKFAPTGASISVNTDISRLDKFGNKKTVDWMWSPLELRITQPIFKANTMKWDNYIMDMEIKNMENKYAEAMESISIEATNQFFSLYRAKSAVEIADFNKRNNDTLYILSQGRYSVGKIAENDLLQSELEKIKSNIALENSKLFLQQTIEQFKTAIGIDISENADIAVETKYHFFEIDPKKAIIEALHNRSSVTNYEIDTERAKRNLESVKSKNSFNADLELMVGLNKSSTNLQDPFSDLSDKERITFGFSIPVFQWGKGDAEIEAALLQLENVKITIDRDKAKFTQEIKYAVLRFKLEQKQLAVASKSDTIAKKRYEVAKNRFLIGKIDLNDLYLAQKSRDDAFNRYVSSIKGYWEKYYRIRSLTLYDFKENKPIRYSLKKKF